MRSQIKSSAWELLEYVPKDGMEGPVLELYKNHPTLEFFQEILPGGRH